MMNITKHCMRSTVSASRRSAAAATRSLFLQASVAPIASSQRIAPLRFFSQTINASFRVQSAPVRAAATAAGSEPLEADSIHGPSDLVVELQDMNDFKKHVNLQSPAIILDFYADWCGPCKQLSPILEKLAVELKGRIKICKINADTAPELAQEFRIEVLPTLYAIVGGQAVAAVETGLKSPDFYKSWALAIIQAHDQMVLQRNQEQQQGAQQPQAAAGGAGAAAQQAEDQLPEPEDTSSMTPHDRLALAHQYLDRNMHQKALKIFEEILSDETAAALQPKAYAGILMTLSALGDMDSCDAIVKKIDQDHPVWLREDADIKRQVSLLSITRQYMAVLNGEQEPQAAESSAADASQQQDEARLKSAVVFFMQGKEQSAIDEALALLRKTRGQGTVGTGAKDLLINMFNVLGPQNKLTVAGRKRMASALF